MCVYGTLNCKDCPVYKLFCKYGSCKALMSKSGFLVSDCDELLYILVQNINDNLSQQASKLYVSDAYSLITSAYNAKVRDVVGFRAYLKMCYLAVTASISQSKFNVQKMNTILVFFETTYTFHKKDMGEEDRANYEAQYNLLLCQLLQKSKNYRKALEEAGGWLLSSGAIGDGAKRVKAQLSNAEYLLGKQERDNKLKRESKSLIYSLVEKLGPHQLSSLHYFVLAKQIEHHTETMRYSEVQTAVKEVKEYLEISLQDNDISSVEKATNKVIFHRDAYRALQMVGDNKQCMQHLKIANEVAEKFNLSDQIEKIRKIENELKYVHLHEDFAAPRIQKHICDTASPYFLISYSHKDEALVKNDIYRSLKKYNYWVDFENLTGGRSDAESDWTEQVFPVISDEMCKGVLVYCSPHSVQHSIGALLEAEWLEQHRDKAIYVLICDFADSLSPKKAADYLDSIQEDDSKRNLQIKNSFSYILQATQSEDRYSYYFYSQDGAHLKQSDFKNWISKILATN